MQNLSAQISFLSYHIPLHPANPGNSGKKLSNLLLIFYEKWAICAVFIFFSFLSLFYRFVVTKIRAY